MAKNKNMNNEEYKDKKNIYYTKYYTKYLLYLLNTILILTKYFTIL